MIGVFECMVSLPVLFYGVDGSRHVAYILNFESGCTYTSPVVEMCFVPRVVYSFVAPSKDRPLVYGHSQEPLKGTTNLRRDHICMTFRG